MLRDVFDSKISEEQITLPSGGTVELAFFEMLFNDVELITYDDLIAKDNGELGYKPFFDQCKTEGILL